MANWNKLKSKSIEDVIIKYVSTDNYLLPRNIVYTIVLFIFLPIFGDYLTEPTHHIF